MQLKFSANLAAVGFPLWTTLQGRTVLIGRLDQSKVNSSNSSTNSKLLAKETSAPEALYMHNVIPTVQGYKSVSYLQAILAHTGNEVFTAIVTIRNDVEALTFLASTSAGTYLLYDSKNNIWVDVTPVGVGDRGLTTAFASGVTYISFSLGGVFKVDLDTLTLEAVTLIGLDTSGIIGIASSNNYLIVHDGETIHWSSASDPTDFVPSVATGAGSGIPTELKGNIIVIGELSTGFAVYSNANIVLASFSGNIRFPWIFKEAANGSGVTDYRNVSFSGENGTNYAWTSAGLLRVALTGATSILPEVTDFLAGRVMEDFDELTDTLSVSYLTDPLKIQLLYSSSRYLVISYGVTTLTHCLVYDTSLKRMGKLRIDHVEAFELAINLDQRPVRYKDLIGNSYESLTFPYNALEVVKSAAADPKRLLAFLKVDGSVEVANFDFGDFTGNAVLLMGKYQLVRSNLLSLQGVEIEAIDTANANFSLSVQSSVDGKTLAVPSTPYLNYDANNIKEYLCDLTAKNHSILMKGAFNIVSMDLTIAQHGRD